MRKILSVILLSLISTNLYAKSDIKFLERQVSFIDKTRTGKVTIYNQGDKSGTAKIIFQKKIIQPDGKVSFEDLDHEYNKYPHNIDLSKYIKISPKQVTLAPKEKQTFRLFFKKPQDFPEGEYIIYAFLDTQTISEENPATVKSGTISASVNFKIRYGIPILVTHGKLTANILDINDITIHSLPNKKTSLKFSLSRNGNSSINTYVKLLHKKSKYSKPKEIFSRSSLFPPDHEIIKKAYNFKTKKNIKSYDPGTLILQIIHKKSGNVLIERIIN